MVNPSWSEDESAARQRLSLLADGEAQPGDAERVCTEWRHDAEARVTWHAYHLIGDVLRSEDLAHPVQRDESFLVALRERLATEPVVLAPAAPRRARRPAWMAPVAAAAGVVAVAGVVVVMRAAAPLGGEAPAAATLAQTPNPAAVVPVSTAAAPDAGNPVVITDSQLIRDARLERYLAAHKQYGSSSAVSVPGVVLRSSTTQVPQR